MFQRGFLRVALLALGLAVAGGSVGAQDLNARFEAEKTAKTRLVMAAMPEGQAMDLLGAIIGTGAQDNLAPALLAQTLFAKGHYVDAAFLFLADFDLEDRTESLNNFAAAVAEVAAQAPDVFGADMLEWAGVAAELAIMRDPSNAAYQNTLSRVRLIRAGPGADGPMLSAALDPARRAVELDPEEPIYWSNMARILMRMGDDAGAAEALERARQAGPDTPGYWVAALAMGQNPEPPASSGADGGADAGARACNVNFRCEEICPKSIIGQIEFVSCKLEEDTQLGNCKAGKPFATAYNCNEQFPVFGVQLPGLNSGFSVCVPGFCVHVKTNSEGGFDVQVQADYRVGPFEAGVKSEGKYTPSNGFSFTKFAGGVRYNFVNKNAVGREATRWNLSPVSVKGEVDSDGKTTLSGDAYGGGVIVF